MNFSSINIYAGMCKELVTLVPKAHLPNQVQLEPIQLNCIK